MFEGFQAPRQRRIGNSRQPVFQLDDVNVDQMVAGGEGLVDRLIRRVNNGRNWGGSSGRAYIGNTPNPIGAGTVDIYQGAAVDSSVSIPGINMERPTPQPAQPASSGVEYGPQVADVDIDPDLRTVIDTGREILGHPPLPPTIAEANPFSKEAKAEAVRKSVPKLKIFKWKSWK